MGSAEGAAAMFLASENHHDGGHRGRNVRESTPFFFFFFFGNEWRCVMGRPKNEQKSYLNRGRDLDRPLEQESDGNGQLICVVESEDASLLSLAHTSRT